MDGLVLRVLLLVTAHTLTGARHQHAAGLPVTVRADDVHHHLLHADRLTTQTGADEPPLLRVEGGAGGAGSPAGSPVGESLGVPTAGVARHLQLYGSRLGLVGGRVQDGAGVRRRQCRACTDWTAALVIPGEEVRGTVPGQGWTLDRGADHSA